MKPNTKFDLSVNDIEIIERALRAKAGRRGMKILKGEGDFVTLKCEADEIMDLLGRLHQQKTWFRPKKETYVGG
jgi:hypothetical protein